MKDITIIGAGPTGLFAAFYAGMRGASVKIIESLPQPGGQLSALYPEKFIYDVAAFPAVRAQELIDRLVEQMNRFPVELCLEEAVQSLEKNPDGSIVLGTDKGKHETKAVIITAGNGAFQPRRLELDGADALPNVHYFVNDLSSFSGRRVAVLGGGDSAVDWAMMLEKTAKEVTIIHRRDKFRAHEHSVDLLHKSDVQIMTPFVPVSFDGQTLALEEVKGDQKKSLEIDDLLVNYGFISSLGPMKNWGLNIEKNSIVVNSRMETNIPGVYAAGDVATYAGKVKLIATGFGEAPTAVNNAKSYIDPDAKVQPLHSTSLF
ncbi:NAD(P)/FAD-dependent oxidoreductase [Domibacillus sp. DTU_2020_1001157_1_SI_ALB_TIR_016]|uniref:NAD(P)/FAD-dependent oxidoreductase n=1 Tax=Domibacillus sp. DTU_2020_1001157_1_SI_ALB_TIR_016 TaxID=3077789 RepID=UPI0028E77334|nr:NAD(P)/FAD-dependent oxidoreductase [Domibacillus sp. DTU_2020_1001157_1_SI_ALB_TIR_016]WNS81623.1 NAD(P)/FAD-dependent oxidoreductase [Domibacillus sp. DTU_2020_1001157_1_SI_ALB_TIR_016]